MPINKLRAADSALALLVFFPSLVVYWRGSWDLISAIIYPGREPLCYWVQTAIGCCTVFDYYLCPVLNKYITPQNKKTYFILSRLFLIWHGALYMFIWRGVWGLGDYYVTREPNWALLQLIIILAILISLRCLRHTIWPPFITAMDKNAEIFVAANRFGVEPERSSFLYFLDASFTCLFITPVAVTAWRCQWAIIDGVFFPGDSWIYDFDSPEALKSDIVCAASGMVGCALIFALQEAFGAVSTKLEKAGRYWAKLIWEDFTYLLIFLVMTVIWHGFWNLCIRYCITDPFTGGLVNHCIGTVLLLVPGVFSLVGACGCAVDGFDIGGDAFFPVNYCSILVLLKRLKDDLHRQKSFDDGAHDDDENPNNPMVKSRAQSLPVDDSSLVQIKHGRHSYAGIMMDQNPTNQYRKDSILDKSGSRLLGQSLMLGHHGRRSNFELACADLDDTPMVTTEMMKPGEE